LAGLASVLEVPPSVGGFIGLLGDNVVVRRAVLVLVIVLVVSTLCVVTSPNSSARSREYFDAEDENVTIGDFSWLDSNKTGNLSAALYADLLPPYHENEGFQIAVVWADEYEEEDPNRTVDVRLGLDSLEPPDEILKVVRFGGGFLPLSKEYSWMALSFVVPVVGNELIVANVTTDEGSMNLSYPIEVLPSRTLLSAELDTPDGNWTGRELEWAAIPVLIVNDGGAPAANMVVDFRYDGRIIDTQMVSLLPPHGNFSTMVTLLPINEINVMEVHLVTGPGAPTRLANLTLNVTARPILDVVLVRATPTKIETGSKVHLEAVIVNRGNATSTGQYVQLMVDSTVVANASIEGLGPGNETIVAQNWTLNGVGTHTVSAFAEGDEFAARPVAVEVKEKTPALGAGSTLGVLLTVVIVTQVARRSRSAGRA
jgi:hypothetical protein